MLLFILAFLNGYDIMFIYFYKTINLNINRQGSEDYTMDRHGLVCRAVLEQPDITQRELAGKPVSYTHLGADWPDSCGEAGGAGRASKKREEVYPCI